MTEPVPPNSDPNDGPEMDRLRRLSSMPQARLDMNFVHLIEELRDGIEGLYLTIRYSKIDHATTLDEDLRKIWAAHIVLTTQIARHLAITAEEADKRVRQILAVE